jgi:hypothetical protein
MVGGRRVFRQIPQKRRGGRLNNTPTKETIVA